MSLQPLQDDIVSQIPFVVFFSALLAFGLYKAISMKTNSKKGKLIKLVFLCVIITICLIAIVIDGKTYILMIYDYVFSDYNVIEGSITNVNVHNSITGNYVCIGNEKFYCNQRYSLVLRESIGKNCKLIYGANSKYIIHYLISASK